MIGSGSGIGENAVIEGPAVIGESCSVQEHAVISNAVIWNSIDIGAFASINHSIIGNSVVVEKGRKIKDCVITPSATATLAGNTKK
jgi:NDP-sugar pyrophosphorylase family protein